MLRNTVSTLLLMVVALLITACHSEQIDSPQSQFSQSEVKAAQDFVNYLEEVRFLMGSVSSAELALVGPSNSGEYNLKVIADLLPRTNFSSAAAFIDFHRSYTATYSSRLDLLVGSIHNLDDLSNLMSLAGVEIHTGEEKIDIKRCTNAIRSQIPHITDEFADRFIEGTTICGVGCGLAWAGVNTVLDFPAGGGAQLDINLDYIRFQCR